MPRSTSTNTLISIVGPTGSGKSDFAVALSLEFDRLTGIGNLPIISTDSRQVYRGMKIGTAQPGDYQLDSVPHYFIADREPTERFTCADFEREALELLENLFASQIADSEGRKFVIAVGGSGLYIDALCKGLDELPDVDHEIRKSLIDRLSQSGLKPLLEQLQELDPVYYDQVDRQNPARVQRALEVCLQTGRPFSSFRTGAPAPERMGEKDNSRPFNIVKIGIEMPREELYHRIDKRVDAMMVSGLKAEARALYPLRQLPALQTVGYRELFQYFNYLEEQNISDDPVQLTCAVELIKRNSRRYAKRQMTWFHRDGEIHWLLPADLAAAIDLCMKKSITPRRTEH